MAGQLPPAQVQYFEQHADDDRRPLLFAISIFSLALAVVAVALRFAARLKCRLRPAADDWFIVVALASAAIVLCCGLC